VKRNLVIAFIFSLLCPASSRAGTKPTLESEIVKTMESYDAIGLSIVVVKNNKICYRNTFGYNPNYTDTTKREPIPLDGVFWWASVSKTFISTAVMQLVEKRMLSLDDDVNKYLDFRIRNPRFPNAPITVSMMLSHRSSLNDKGYRYGFEKLIPEVNVNYRVNYNDYEPDTDYFYCNMNYNLLAAIVEKVSKKRFDVYVRENITKPLGLYGSFNRLDLDSVRIIKTYTYDRRAKRFKKYFYPSDRLYGEDTLRNYILGRSTPIFSPAGGMRATTMDLAKWMMVHMNYGTYKKAKILSKESELEMWKPRSPGRNYGYAFSHYDNIVKGESFVGMTGGSCGIHSLFFCNPEKKYGFVVICNGCTSKWGNGGNMNYEIVRVLYKHFIKK